jgi:Fe-S-cluster containining protein
MKRKDKRPFYHEGLQFECTRCGGCCSGFPGYVWLAETEVDRLSDHLGIERAEFISRYTKFVRGIGQPRISLIEKEGFDCIFFDDGCTIYEARPYQCRSYPFWSRNIVSLSDWEQTADFCPGVNRGRNYSQEEIDAFLSDVPEYNIRRFSPLFRRQLGF